MIWRFAPLALHAYSVILADPPWKFLTFSDTGDKSKTPEHHYRTMPFAELQALPVHQLGRLTGSVLILWTTFPMLGRAMQLMNDWQFKYKTGGPWTKQSRSGKKYAFGTGYIYRNAAEMFLLGTRGEPRVRSKSVRNLIADDPGLRGEWAITAPLREHSRKPEQMYHAIEELFLGPYCELFARRRRTGWESWGDQLEPVNPGGYHHGKTHQGDSRLRGDSR